MACEALRTASLPAAVDGAKDTTAISLTLPTPSIRTSNLAENSESFIDGVIFQHRLAWSPIDKFSAPATGPGTRRRTQRDCSRVICLPPRVLYHSQGNKLFAGSWPPAIAS